MTQIDYGEEDVITKIPQQELKKAIIELRRHFIAKEVDEAVRKRELLEESFTKQK